MWLRQLFNKMDLTAFGGKSKKNRDAVRHLLLEGIVISEELLLYFN